MKIAVVSYGLGNALSVVRMYETLGIHAQTVTKTSELASCSHLVLPGVGHFGFAASLLTKSGWDEAIVSFAHERLGSVLGICLGAQLLGGYSEESDSAGLGLLPITSVKLAVDLPVPNMGWRSVTFSPGFTESHPQFNSQRYYFSHSFEMTATDTRVIIGKFSYDGDRVAAVRSGNITAVQFHPEKSHRFGKTLLQWFAHT